MKLLFTYTFLLALAVGATAQTTLAEHHYESDKITNVVINGSFCDVIVTEGNRIVFDAIIQGKGKEGDYVIGSIETGNTVVFNVDRKVKNSSWSWSSDGKRRITLTLPKGTSLSVDNSSGDIKVEDYQADELVLNASSGDIALKRIEADCNLRNTSGDVIAREITGDIIMRSTSGDQQFSEIEGSIKTRSTSGDIELYGAIGDVQLSATSGDIQFDDVKGSLAVSTTSGEIEGDYVELTDDSRFKSTSGDISVDFKNDLKTLSFDLRASSGDLEVGNIDADDELMIDRGGIKITGISTSGDQAYRD